ncbi:hypothetical protein BR93DRAFT_832398 [Coniochaeta sp. PMI_546]|nr:hypothetical protein BR93DRAFT_832398 [Coniochaeta sp. PMI_546]
MSTDSFKYHKIPCREASSHKHQLLSSIPWNRSTHITSTACGPASSHPRQVNLWRRKSRRAPSGNCGVHLVVTQVSAPGPVVPPIESFLSIHGTSQCNMDYVVATSEAPCTMEWEKMTRMAGYHHSTTIVHCGVNQDARHDELALGQILALANWDSAAA